MEKKTILIIFLLLTSMVMSYFAWQHRPKGQCWNERLYFQSQEETGNNLTLSFYSKDSGMDLNYQLKEFMTYKTFNYPDQKEKRWLIKDKEYSLTWCNESNERILKGIGTD